MENPPVYLTYDQLTKLNDNRLNNVKKSIIRKKACLDKILSCESYEPIIQGIREDVAPLNSYLEVIYDVIKLRRR